MFENAPKQKMSSSPLPTLQRKRKKRRQTRGKK